MAIYSTLLLLISNAVTFRRDKSIFFNRVVIIILSYCFYSGLESWVISFLVLSIGMFGGLFYISSVTQTFQIFVYIISGIIVQITSFYSRKVWTFITDNPLKRLLYNFVYQSDSFLNKMSEQFKIIEYPLLLLFVIIGSVFLMSSCDIVSIFLCIELQSYGLYILATIYKNSELSTSAGLTYFLLGGLSSCFILLGSSLLYSNSGSTILDGYYIITGISNMADYLENNMNLDNLSYLSIPFLIMSIGLLFKISAAPFHFWSPDVYDAIPTIVTTFIAIIAKISILVLLLELVIFTTNLLFHYYFNWTYSLLLSSFLSFIIGTILGLSQSRIKRLFAYSTISHVGFILLSIAINTMESIEAFIFYLLQYTLSNLNAFIILISIGISMYYLVYENNKAYKAFSGDLPERNNSPIQLITELKGYFYINPFLALSLAITLFSFVGIPPLMGFFAKQMVLSSALSGGYIFLSIIAILTSVISASYYLNVIKELFFEKSNLIFNKELVHKTYKCKMIPYIKSINTLEYNYKIYNVTISSFLTFNISVITLLILLFMLASQEWLNMTRLLSLILIKK